DVTYRANEERHYYQEFIPGFSRSAVFLGGRNGCELLGVTEQLSGISELPEEPFLYSGSRTTLSPKLDFELKELGDVLTRDFRLLGLFNLDYVDDGCRIWPLEINPRYSASVEVLEHAQGKNFLAMHVVVCDPDFSSELRFQLKQPK